MADLGSIAITSTYILEISSYASQQNNVRTLVVNNEIHGLSTAANTTASIPEVSLDYSRYVPVFALDSRGYFSNTLLGKAGIPINGTIAGTVKENGVVVSNKLVALYYRPSLQLISTTKSGIGGVYSFSGLEAGISDYFIISLNDKPLQFDAVIHDTITAA